MAYANLINQTCSSGTQEVFQRMRDFLCKRDGTYDYSTTGVGWTLHDSYYAADENNCAIGDWFVVKSVGESGDEDLYFCIKWHEANHMNLTAALYWNAVTHVGVQVYGYILADVFYADDDGTISLWIYSDLDSFKIITKPATIYYGADAGRSVNLIYDDTVATCAGALNSGSDISITVDAVPSEWAVDRNLFIRDTADIEKITIKTLIGTTITADLTNSYLAGSKLVADLCYYCSSGNTMPGARYVLISHLGTMNQTLTPYYNTAMGYCDPDEMNAEPVGFPLVMGHTSLGVHGELKNVLRIDASIPGVSSEDVFTDVDGVNWRVFMCYNSAWFAFKEV